MTGRLIPQDTDAVGRTDTPITVTFDGRPLPGIAGQTLAGVLLANGTTAWRTDVGGRPRGLFCGIGACFECLATVNDLRDVRLCRRRAHDGDIVTPQTREST